MAQTLTLNNISSGYNLSQLNDNFVLIQNWANTYPLLTQSGQNVMSQDLDMNGHNLLNITSSPGNPSGLVTISFANATYFPYTGGTLTGTLNMGSNILTGLAVPVNPTDAVRNQDLQTEVANRTNADASLQSQISGGAPLQASAFSPISWHTQQITNSVTIPPNVNAWSFGPTVTLANGSTVTIGSGSYWTIADGQVH